MLSYSQIRAIRSCFKHSVQKCIQAQRRFLCDYVRVRFAPSPTGFLHIGGLRTALYNYLFAKSHPNGKFIVRIEDTDQARVVAGAAANLLSILEWTGIKADESPFHGGKYGPYTQSERLQSYQESAESLVARGAAYRCFCTPQRLNILKRDQLQRREAPKYDNRCRNLEENIIQTSLKQNKPYVIRLKLCDGVVIFNDALFGEINHNVASIEGDPILLKSDGYPTYHLANVVDDHLMDITHVIRGKEWLTSTPKHINIYNAMEWRLPTFMHLPLLLNSDRSKLSKRQGSVYVEQLKEKGYSPSAVLNFMAYYGSGFNLAEFPVCHSDEREVLKMLSAAFDYRKIMLSDAMVNFSKLDEFSKSVTTHSLSIKDYKWRDELCADTLKLVRQKYRDKCVFLTDVHNGQAYINRILETRKTHLIKLNDLLDDEYDYLWLRPEPIGLKNSLPEFSEGLRDIVRFLQQTDEFEQKIISQFLRTIAKNHRVKFSSLMRYLRILLSGKEGPGVADMIFMLGRQETLLRLSEKPKRIS
ncbi:nondiscriminating glutamyl-tRNA synthetase EARS2, mitochondrial-like isoform X2 [Clavelina lepadiformis]|uniref:nondiscriminating glutamyl-tRNA synthetase EARS2, mitochondrial-like isoform X2 n=1 Tax=Clavelina lepadiformis TaxID=159417 RepID=UPI0040435E5A